MPETDMDETTLTQTKVPSDIVQMARVIVAHNGKSIAEVIGEAARSNLRRTYRTVVKTLNNELGEAGA